MKYSIAVLSLLVAHGAWALGVPEPPKHQPTPGWEIANEQNQGQIQGQQQGQHQGQQQGQNQVATGGDAVAIGGSSDQSQQQSVGDITTLSIQDQSANNEGVTVQTTYRQVRQTPPVAQGSLMIGNCGVGANAGGSSAGGAGFLGITWTPRECHKYLVAQNYAALGMYSFSCAILNTTRATKETVEELRIEFPSCDFHEHRVVEVEEVRYVTPEELDAVRRDLVEGQDRIFRATQGERK